MMTSEDRLEIDYKATTVVHFGCTWWKSHSLLINQTFHRIFYGYCKKHISYQASLKVVYIARKLQPEQNLTSRLHPNRIYPVVTLQSTNSESEKLFSQFLSTPVQRINLKIGGASS